MCKICRHSPADLQTMISIDCSGCPEILALPDLPACLFLNCMDCPKLERLGALPLVRRLVCAGASVLTALPELPACVELNCNKCSLLPRLPALPECLYLHCAECPLLERLPDLSLCLTLKCPRSRLLREVPRLAEHCRELDVSSCTNLIFIPLPVPETFQARRTFCEVFPRTETECFGRPYRIKLRPFWNHWVKYTLRKRNYRVLARLVPRYPGLQDVLRKIVG